MCCPGYPHVSSGPWAMISSSKVKNYNKLYTSSLFTLHLTIAMECYGMLWNIARLMIYGERKQFSMCMWNFQMVLLSLTSRVNNHAVSFSRRLCCQPAVPASFDSCKVLLVDPPKPNPPSLHLVLGTSLMACVAKFGNTNIQTHTHTLKTYRYTYIYHMYTNTTAWQFDGVYSVTCIKHIIIYIYIYLFICTLYKCIDEGFDGFCWMR